MHGIPRALGCSAYLSVWLEVGALCVERLAAFAPSLPHPLLSTVYQCDGCLSSCGCEGSCLVCQVLPAIGAVSILELAANSGSSRMSRAPNLHIATKLFIIFITFKGVLEIFTVILMTLWNWMAIQPMKPAKKLLTFFNLMFCCVTTRV